MSEIQISIPSEHVPFMRRTLLGEMEIVGSVNSDTSENAEVYEKVETLSQQADVLRQLEVSGDVSADADLIRSWLSWSNDFTKSDLFDLHIDTERAALRAEAVRNIASRLEWLESVEELWLAEVAA